VRVFVAPAAELELAIRDIVLDAIRQKPEAVLMFPTGSTPEGVYAALVSQFRRRRPGAPNPSWSQARCLNMDEYWRMPSWDRQSYAWFMKSHLYDWVDVSTANIYYPDAMAPTAEEACQAYEAQIEALGGIDHCLLGIGVNGHIAFNEPGYPRTRTHLVELTESTIEANQRFFEPPEAMPTQALTAGLDTLLASRRITLLATGAAKAEAVRDALTADPGNDCPASFLQALADRCTFYLDEEAASLLPGEAP
jgi:glucosamine-6-phosphate deaminase